MKKICPYCNAEFESNHAKRIYCSDSHRISAYYKRKGFKVAIVPPQEKGLSGIPSETVPGYPGVNENKTNQDLKDIGISALGTLVGMKTYNMLSSKHNRPITYNEMVTLLNEHLDIVAKMNQKMVEQIKGTNFGV